MENGKPMTLKLSSAVFCFPFLINDDFCQPAFHKICHSGKRRRFRRLTDNSHKFIFGQVERFSFRLNDEFQWCQKNDYVCQKTRLIS